MKERPIIFDGDIVKHRPTGETWIVVRVVGDYVEPAGWPTSQGRISDCTMVKQAVAGSLLILREVTQ